MVYCVALYTVERKRVSRGRIEINIFYFRGQYPILYRRAHSLIVSCVCGGRTSVDTRRGYAYIERLIRERERGGEGEEEREERKRKRKKKTEKDEKV